MLPEFFKFQLRTKVLYGAGLTSRLGQELSVYIKEKHRAIVFTDKVLAKNGSLDILKKGLSDSNIEIAAIYDDIPANSELEVVNQSAALGKKNNCSLIIALGGGSVMDTAKIANILMVKGGDVSDHMGAQLVQEALLPSIFIPTTSGTGSEATEFAVILDKKSGTKLPFNEEAILPDFAILDPKLTVSLPAKLTASTGMDALTHAIESYVSNQDNPVSSALSLYTIELIHANILQACAVPDDLEARGAMLVASFLAGVAFNHAGVGIVHAISHALGGVYHIPHGVANSIMLPLGMEHNLDTSAARFARIAETIGSLNLKPAGELAKLAARFDIPALGSAIENLSFIDDWLTQAKARSLIEYIRDLNCRLKAIAGLPTNLKEAGVGDGLAKLDEVVTKALDDGAILYNPAPADEAQIRKIIEQAYKQNLPGKKTAKGEFKAAKLHLEKRRPKNVYSDANMLYDVLVGFFEILREHPVIGPKLQTSGLSVRFTYANPDSAIVIDGTTPQVRFLKGESAKAFTPMVEMSMQADFAHYFWHGKANVLQALARREVTAKGNLPAAMRLLPILQPAYTLFPSYLKKKGLNKIVVD